MPSAYDQGKTSGNHNTLGGTIINYMLLQTTFIFLMQQKEITNEHVTKSVT
jgi:hypothetical protein